jgi:hypothetical protein
VLSETVLRGASESEIGKQAVPSRGTRGPSPVCPRDLLFQSDIEFVGIAM